MNPDEARVAVGVFRLGVDLVMFWCFWIVARDTLAPWGLESWRHWRASRKLPRAQVVVCREEDHG